jgi:hypothetical protein
MQTSSVLLINHTQFPNLQAGLSTSYNQIHSFTIPAHLLHGNSEELVIYCVSVIKWQVVTFNTGLWYQELTVF